MRTDRVSNEANYIIAISPFLADIGKKLYGDKFSVIPLGIDSDIFYYDESIEKNKNITVVCSGTVYPRKRPELFVELANKLPNVEFVWYGEGELLDQMRTKAENMCCGNIQFVGAVDHLQLASNFRKADLFVLPSRSEGVPKVSQEAAACGLPLVLFGFYEAPTVVDGKNGYVVWNDEEFIETVSGMVGNRGKLNAMGRASAKMAASWSWDAVAPQWEGELTCRLRREIS